MEKQTYFRLSGCLGLMAGLLLVVPAWSVRLAAAEEPVPSPLTTGDPNIPLLELRWLLKPLPQSQLKVEADAWQGLLQEKVQQISDAEVTVLRQKEQIKQTKEAAEAAKDAKEAAAKAEAASTNATSGAQATKAAEEAKKKAEEARRAVAKAQELDAKAAADTNSQAALAVAQKVSDEQQAKAAEEGDTNAPAVAVAEVASPALQNVSTNAVTESTAQLENVASAVEAAADKQAAKKEVLLDTLTELRTQRADLIERLDLVLAELKAKGGEVATYENYATSAAQNLMDVSDSSAVWKFAVGWLKSEQGGMKWLLNISKFVAIFVVFWLLALLVGKATSKATSRARGMSELLRQFVNTVSRRAVLVLGLLFALSAIGIPIAPVVGVLTAAGFVIGFALQGTLSNFASGLLMLIYRPFDVGDAVEAGGASGSIAAMNLMTTRFNTWDNKVVIVPNNQIWGSVITNISRTSRRRVDMVFGIGYGDSMDKAQTILERIIAEHPKVLKDPAPVIRVNALGESSVDFIVRPWVLPADYWAVYWDVTRKVKEEFDREGVSIPFPQRDVHLYQEKD
ncbi:MAG: mechanosensitive ion channel family protein [Verrucomicrobiales bacterium]|nr:mechanosensitive ion channel family protein [Verrucomicrobiales bacterium]